MRVSPQQRPIVVADDDPDDRLLVEAALHEAHVRNPIDFVEDGEELLRYLRRQGEYTAHASKPLPALVLVDINMPRMTGLELLREVRSDASLRWVPIVLLTTSNAEHDVRTAYDLGGNAFITKPSSFDALVEAMASLARFWLAVASLPDPS